MFSLSYDTEHAVASAKKLELISVVSGMELEGPFWEMMWPFQSTSPLLWNHAKKYGPYGELFLFFLMKKESNEPTVSTV